MMIFIKQMVYNTFAEVLPHSAGNPAMKKTQVPSIKTEIILKKTKVSERAGLYQRILTAPAPHTPKYIVLS